MLYNSGMSHKQNQNVTIVGRLGRGWATDPFVMAVNKGIHIRGSYTLPKGTLGIINRYSPQVSDVAIVDANLPEYTQRPVIAHMLDKYEELSPKTRPGKKFSVTIKETNLQQH